MRHGNKYTQNVGTVKGKKKRGDGDGWCWGGVGGFVTLRLFILSPRVSSLPLANHRVSWFIGYGILIFVKIRYSVSFTFTLPPPNPTYPSPHPTYTSAKTLSDSDIFRTLPPPFDLSGFSLFRAVGDLFLSWALTSSPTWTTKNDI